MTFCIGTIYLLMDGEWYQLIEPQRQPTTAYNNKWERERKKPDSNWWLIILSLFFFCFIWPQCMDVDGWMYGSFGQSNLFSLISCFDLKLLLSLLCIQAPLYSLYWMWINNETHQNEQENKQQRLTKTQIQKTFWVVFE